jgi:hypothetical protein
MEGTMKHINSITVLLLIILALMAYYYPENRDVISVCTNVLLIIAYVLMVFKYTYVRRLAQNFLQFATRIHGLDPAVEWMCSDPQKKERILSPETYEKAMSVFCRNVDAMSRETLLQLADAPVYWDGSYRAGKLTDAYIEQATADGLDFKAVMYELATHRTELQQFALQKIRSGALFPDNSAAAQPQESEEPPAGGKAGNSN